MFARALLVIALTSTTALAQDDKDVPETPYEGCVRKYAEALLASKKNNVESFKFSTSQTGHVNFKGGSQVRFAPDGSPQLFIKTLVQFGVPGEAWLDHLGLLRVACPK